jgi:hypothetical protein
MKSLKYATCLTVAVALAMAVKVSAGETTGASPFLGVLSTATSAELPAKAAELVTQADAKNLKQTTIDVVKAAVGLNPAAAPAIVGSIAQASPATAATAAATAVTLVPNQAVAIARAAAAAAPAKAGAIVEAICRVLPKSYQDVANAVAEVVPGAGKEILAGIAAAIPELKSIINQTLASYDGKIPSVSAVLTQVDQAQNLAGTTTSLASATPSGTAATPAVFSPNVQSGPPAVPPSATPALDPTPAPPTPTRGGHTYSAP